MKADLIAVIDHKPNLFESRPLKSFVNILRKAKKSLLGLLLGRNKMKFLHSMVRVRDLDASLNFYCKGLGLKEIRRIENENGKFTLVFLAVEEGEPCIELTYNWGSTEDYGNARNFGHLAYQVDDIYEYCTHLQSCGIEILRPPRDGHMAFVKSPDQISVEILQKGNSLPKQEPWASMQNKGEW